MCKYVTKENPRHKMPFFTLTFPNNDKSKHKKQKKNKLALM